jgi:hypothetical protein
VQRIASKQVVPQIADSSAIDVRATVRVGKRRTFVQFSILFQICATRHKCGSFRVEDMKKNQLMGQRTVVG